MAQHEEEASPRVQYPLNSEAYRILDEIGVGVSAVVYKAECLPMNSALVAIKSIDLDQSRADLDSVLREVKTMSLLSHPNILRAHCSFAVDHRLWVVMPFMSAGSLQSIIGSSFPDGLPEPCIAIVLKETLNALSYLHDQGHLHRDIKAGNILVDSTGTVKLADFGVSALIYESNTSSGTSGSSSSSSLMLTEVTGTPYWMAPEVIHSHTGYSLKADIWSFGITALELAHGRPPLSHLPPSKSLVMKITKRFRFSDYEQSRSEQSPKFSKSFKDMVASCLDQDPSKRPSADKLLKHPFFKNCKNSEFLVNKVLSGLASVEQRFKESKIRRSLSIKNTDDDGDEEENEESSMGEIIKQRRISGWNFKEDVLELDPVFPSETETLSPPRRQVRFAAEPIIRDPSNESSSDNPGSSSQSVEGVQELHDEHTNEHAGSLAVAVPEGTQLSAQIGVSLAHLDRDGVVRMLRGLTRSLYDQRRAVGLMLTILTGQEEVSREDQLLQENERLKMELEQEKKKTSEMEMEMEFLSLQISRGSTSAASRQSGE